MKDWKEYKLGDIGTVVGGATPSTKEVSNYDGNIPWITPKDLANHNSRYISRGERMISQKGYDSCSCRMLPTNSILFSSRAPIGYVAIANGELCTNQGFKSIIPNDNVVDSLFLYYLLVYYKPVIENMGSGTTFKEVSGSVMRDLVVSMPEIEEQKKIAAILSSLDDKIELNRRINDNLEQQAQALFKAWFVDFEPFKDGKFLDSELGRIPEGWKVGHFTDIVKVSGGGTPKTNNPLFWNGSIPFFTPKDASDIVFTYETEKHITDLGVSNCNSPIYPAYTVFITARGTIGKIRMAGTPMAMNQSCYALLTTKEKLEPYIYLLSLRLVNIMRKKANGAVFEAITTKDFEENIVIPPNEILTCFTKLVNPLFSQIHHNGLENQNIVTLRDTLLPQLMSGELRINTITE